MQRVANIAAIDTWILLSNLDQFDFSNVYGGRGLGVIATVNAEATAGGYQTVSIQITTTI